MVVTASKLRANVYRLLDEVLETGRPITVRRKGRMLRIAPELPAGSKLARLTPRPCIKGDPEDLVHIDWSTYWSGGKGL